VTDTRKPVIGLAGGIGSGKSAVAEILADLGCVVAHSDEMARAALREPAIREQLVTWWGEGILDEGGEIDRSAVARIVFADPGQRRRLEALTHPWIESRRAEQFAAAPADAPALVIDAPLLFEAGLEEQCDAVIFVDTERPVRLARLKAGRGWEEADLGRREDSQLPLDVKRSGADYVIQNDGNLSDLAAQVRLVLSQIVASHRS
jgi:dephospho-CoA kinase